MGCFFEGMTGVIGCSHIKATLHVKISVLLLPVSWHVDLASQLY